MRDNIPPFSKAVRDTCNTPHPPPRPRIPRATESQSWTGSQLQIPHATGSQSRPTGSKPLTSMAESEQDSASCHNEAQRIPGHPSLDLRPGGYLCPGIPITNEHTPALGFLLRDMGDTRQGHLTIDRGPEVGTGGLWLCQLDRPCQERIGPRLLGKRCWFSGPILISPPGLGARPSCQNLPDFGLNSARILRTSLDTLLTIPDKTILELRGSTKV